MSKGMAGSTRNKASRPKTERTMSDSALNDGDVERRRERHPKLCTESYDQWSGLKGPCLSPPPRDGATEAPRGRRHGDGFRSQVRHQSHARKSESPLRYRARIVGNSKGNADFAPWGGTAGRWTLDGWEAHSEPGLGEFGQCRGSRKRLACPPSLSPAIKPSPTRSVRAPGLVFEERAQTKKRKRRRGSRGGANHDGQSIGAG